MDEQEEAVEQSKDPEASIRYDIRLARLYLLAELKDSATENFGYAAIKALHAKKDDLLEAILKEMKTKIPSLQSMTDTEILRKIQDNIEKRMQEAE